MAELVNKFSWSFSASEDFEECRRRRYWSKYAMWGGWRGDASPIQRAAYRLNKMENRYSIQGQAVEQSVMWALRNKQNGKDVTVEEAYEAVAKPFLNRCWKESTGRLWEADPKRYCCFREQYYKTLKKEDEKAWVVAIVEHVKKCIGIFLEKVLPRLKDVTAGDEIEIRTIEVGDPESFEMSDVKIYAIPDYVYQVDDDFHIHDWKSGKVKESHMQQLAIYGLWANVKHGIPADKIHVDIEYLADGTVRECQLTDADLQMARKYFENSMGDMASYLVDADMKKNEPLPQEEWELAESQRICRMCNFYQLCEKELTM